MMVVERFITTNIFYTDTGPEQKWVIFDGPMDGDWIENMSYAMDDNKILILANGERIPIPKQVLTVSLCDF